MFKNKGKEDEDKKRLQIEEMKKKYGDLKTVFDADDLFQSK